MVLYMFHYCFNLKYIHFRNYNVKIKILFQYFNIPTYNLHIIFILNKYMYRYKTNKGTLNRIMRM